MSVNEDITASISLIIDNPFSSMLDFSHFSGLDKNEADLKPSNQRGNHWAVDYLLGKRLSYTFHFVPYQCPLLCTNALLHSWKRMFVHSQKTGVHLSREQVPHKGEPQEVTCSFGRLTSLATRNGELTRRLISALQKALHEIRWKRPLFLMPFHYTLSFVRYRLFLLFVKSEYNLVVVQILVKNAQRNLKRKSAELHL